MVGANDCLFTVSERQDRGEAQSLLLFSEELTPEKTEIGLCLGSRQLVHQRVLSPAPDAPAPLCGRTVPVHDGYVQIQLRSARCVPQRLKAFVLWCHAAACAAYRGNVDLTLTPVKRTEELCQPHIKYGELISASPPPNVRLCLRNYRMTSRIRPRQSGRLFLCKV